VARAGSVRGAVERLLVSQPAVSAAVAALEREIGAPLVARQGHGLVLTPAGETLAGHAARILGLMDEARSAVREAGAPGTGRLRLVAVTTAGEHVLPLLLRTFRARHPGVEIVLEVGNRRTVWERLRDREADLAVAGRPPAGSGLVGEPFRRNDLVLVGPPGPRRRRSLEPEELAGETWLLREPGSGTRENAEEWLSGVGLAPPTLTIGSNGAIVRLVSLGLGVTLISMDAVRREVGEGDVRVLPVRGLPLRRHWHAVVRAGERLPGPVERFLDLLRRRRPPAGPLRAGAAVSRPAAEGPPAPGRPRSRP
jgi:DNA-binding transcriptional LysR family regulator